MENIHNEQGWPKILSKKEVSFHVNMGERAIEKAVKAKRFPPPVRNGKTVSWDERAIKTYLAERYKSQLAWEMPVPNNAAKTKAARKQKEQPRKDSAGA